MEFPRTETDNDPQKEFYSHIIKKTMPTNNLHPSKERERKVYEKRIKTLNGMLLRRWGDVIISWPGLREMIADSEKTRKREKKKNRNNAGVEHRNLCENNTPLYPGKVLTTKVYSYRSLTSPPLKKHSYRGRKDCTDPTMSS